MFDDTHCPCGGRKAVETMLCDVCVTHFKNTPEMQAFDAADLSPAQRRGPAIRLLAMSRKRMQRADKPFTALCAGGAA